VTESAGSRKNILRADRCLCGLHYDPGWPKTGKCWSSIRGRAIRGALKIAVKTIAVSHPDITVVPDEATRDTSGSPNIALKILEKIAAADVFLADPTTITPRLAKRPCPNPNVNYELGYAVGELGWDRVILLFNEAYGRFPKDLPFDIIQQRASPYRLTESDPNSARKPLEKLLTTAILAVIFKNPKRPSELRGLSREKINMTKM
jgi:hypothetical protein